MHKSTNFTGQPVFNQLLKLLTRQAVEQLSQNTPGSEAYIKKLDGYTHLVIMLFAVFNHFDSLREIEVGMQAEAHKFTHLGLDYMVRRSTLSEANKRRPSEFFAQVYALLLKKYAPFLADSRTTKEQKEWEKLLYMMDSTTISLFDNILKGVGRNPKTGKKKGGMKVHTLMKYLDGVPMVVDLTSAAKHDHYLLKEVHLPKDSTLAIDRAYIDYAQFQRFTDEGVCYVTKMKKNLKHTVISTVNYVNEKAVIVAREQMIVFEKGELRHESLKVDILDKNNKIVTLLTNNVEFSIEDLREIYRRRWAIETLYKQLKQNFQLHFFFGDSVNAIEIQTWVVLIANLLLTVIQHKIKRHCSFSQIVTMVRQTLMYYIDFVAFMENPNRAWQIIQEEYAKSPPKIVQFELKFE
jgi:hypothetical protein